MREMGPDKHTAGHQAISYSDKYPYNMKAPTDPFHKQSGLELTMARK